MSKKEKYIDLKTGQERTNVSELIKEGSSPDKWITTNWNGNDYSDLTGEKITNLYLYGTLYRPLNVEDRLRSQSDTNDKITIRVNMEGYMESGAGRYAQASETKFVNYFMSDDPAISGWDDNGFYIKTTSYFTGLKKDITYSLIELVDVIAKLPTYELGLLGVDVSQWSSQGIDDKRGRIRTALFNASYVNANIDIGSEDYIERTWAMGSAGFVMSWETEFTFDEKNPIISGVAMMPRDDDFDFKSAGLSPTQVFNKWVLKDQFDRFGIGQTVKIDYQGRENVKNIAINTYDRNNYKKEKEQWKEYDDFNKSPAGARGAVNGGVLTAEYAKEHWYDNDTETVDGVEYALVYGSANEDKIDMFYFESKANKPAVDFVINNAYDFPYHYTQNKDYMIV